MLSYRHSFHAGNHADVLKHVIQSLLITALKQKDKPFFYLDTHAGAGCYRLDSPQALKTGEHLQGVARIWQHPNKPPLLSTWLTCLQEYNPDDRLRYYPGSPLIAQMLLRSTDKLLFTELHPTEFAMLKTTFVKDKRISMVRGNGLHQLKASLPPLARRALVLIDPAYEVKTDYQDVFAALQQGYRRFSTGIYALWYPVVRRQAVKRLIRNLQSSAIRNILLLELAVLPDSDQYGMTGSGMIVINPPWKLEQQARELLPWLHKVLVPAGTGHTRIEWLVPE